jgi:hypothetical protein
MQTIEPQCQRHLDAAQDYGLAVVECDLETISGCFIGATFKNGPQTHAIKVRGIVAASSNKAAAGSSKSASTSWSRL